jgi:hypothetical protein
VKQHFGKLAMIVVLGSGFAVAQSTPATSPQSTSPSSQSQPSSTDQQPAAAPDQSSKPANAPETMPSTDQPKSDSSKLPQSDAAPAAAAGGDVQGNIQSAIQKDPSLSSSNVTVNVNAGKSVDLTGTVPTKDAKDSAERIAKENSGGLKVKNHLKVAGASSDTTPKTDTSSPAPKL